MCWALFHSRTSCLLFVFLFPFLVSFSFPDSCYVAWIVCVPTFSPVLGGKKAYLSLKIVTLHETFVCSHWEVSLKFPAVCPHPGRHLSRWHCIPSACIAPVSCSSHLVLSWMTYSALSLLFFFFFLLEYFLERLFKSDRWVASYFSISLILFEPWLSNGSQGFLLPFFSPLKPWGFFPVTH